MLSDREVLDALSTGVLIAGPDEITSHANPAACRMLALDHASCMGQPVPLLLGLSASLRDHGLDELDSERRFVLSLPTGPAGATLRSVDGRGYVCLFRSADAGRGADASLQENERESALGAILAAFAHEVRNPLAALAAAVDLLRTELGTVDASSLDIIDRQVRRLVALSRAPIALGQPSFTQRVRCRVDRLVLGAIAVVAPEAGRRNVEFSLRVEQLPRVVVGEREIVDALAELLENAVHASPPEGIVRVTGWKRPDPERVVIEIVDRGPGMAPAEISEALRAFTTTKPRAVGSGLGLAHRLIRDSGGRLALEPGTDAGLIVRVELPAEELR